MLFESTRGEAPCVKAKQAIQNGLAPDGGLYIPIREDFRIPASDITALSKLSYPNRAHKIISPLLSDYSEEDLHRHFTSAYQSFTHPDVAPVKHIHENLSVLELWHGPTLAFKDMALQVLPYLMQPRKNSETVILAATSGDTGKAALAGFADKQGASCVVFYPKNGVSRIQELQMLTQQGKNVRVIGVTGNFDDAQNGVKAIFRDEAINKTLSVSGKYLSSANSINWGRLAPQIAYYFSAFADLVSAGHPENKPVNFIVPTGNFGNILAAYYARELGLPIKKLICASNRNNVLTDFIRTGVYDRRRPLYITKSPSMDILVSSNLERYLYWASASNSTRIKEWMSSLSEEGCYDTRGEIDMSLFYGGCANDDMTSSAISALYNDYGYLADPHTAVGYSVYEQYIKDTGDATRTVLVSTANPYKFGRDVAKALFGNAPKDEFECCRDIERHTGVAVPKALTELENAPILHSTVCEPSDMGRTLLELV